MSGMGWLAVAGVAVLLLVAVDRMVARGWFDRRTPRDRRSTASPAASGMLGDFVEVFQPNRVHLTAEQERQRLDVVRSGDAAGRLDLDSGVVRLDGGPSSDTR